jgi:hypothetical protein
MAAQLTALELSAITSICELWPEYADAMRAQLAAAQVASRENTGAGFLTSFEVPAGVPPLPPGKPTSATFELNGAELQMGFHIESENGRLAFLEGHAYGGDIGDLDLETVGFCPVTNHP